MRRRGGQAIIETTVVLSVVLALLLGTVQWAWWMFEDRRLQSSLDHAAAIANVGAHDEYLARFYSDRTPGGIALVQPRPDGTYGEDLLPRTSALAKETAAALIHKEGAPGYALGVRYEFERGRARIVVSGGFELPSFVRIWPMSIMSFRFSGEGRRALELFSAP